MASRREPLTLSCPLGDALESSDWTVHSCALLPGSTWPCGPGSHLAHGCVGSTHRLREGAWNGQQPGTSKATWMGTKTTQQPPAGSKGLILWLWTLAFVLARGQLDFFHGRKRRWCLRWEPPILPGHVSTWIKKPLSFCTSIYVTSSAVMVTGSWTPVFVQLQYFKI